MWVRVPSPSFPPPHKFFFAREDEINLGFVYYRKDNDDPSRWGLCGPSTTRDTIPGASPTRMEPAALAPRGAMRQLCPLQRACRHQAAHVGLLLPERPSDDGHARCVLAYTHDDVFKPLPGYKVMTGHFHMDFNEQLRDRNDLDYQPPWVAVFRSLGINILYLGDFHDDSHPQRPGPHPLHGTEGLLRGLRARLRQGFPGHSRRRAQCLHSAATVDSDAQADLLLP